MNPKSEKAKAVEGLRDAYLRLAFIQCMNELEDDQEWIAKSLTTAQRKIGRMLRTLEPDRRLPSVRKDTRLGRWLVEAQKDMKEFRACTHDWKADRKAKKSMGFGEWQICKLCGWTRSVSAK